MDANERRRQAAEEAAEWRIKLESPDVARADREAFVDWLRESALHVAEMLRVAQVHSALGQFNRWADMGTEAGVERESVVELADAVGTPPRHETTRRRWRSTSQALAAILLLALLIGTWWYFDLRSPIIQTDRAERREVALADGSVVEMDPESRLRIAFEPEKRRVMLERGRALFHVAKNPGRPFLVEADGTTVRAVGTAFGVERRDNGIVVTVADGTVAVTDLHGAADAVSVTSGEQVTLPSSGTAHPVRKVDSARELAWAKGRLVFDNRSVASAVREFNRYNRVQLRVTNEALAARPVSAVFDASDPESFIAFLQSVEPVRVSREDPSEIVIAPGR